MSDDDFKTIYSLLIKTEKDMDAIKRRKGSASTKNRDGFRTGICLVKVLLYVMNNISKRKVNK